MASAGFHLFEMSVALSLIVLLAGWTALTTRELLSEQRLQAGRQSLVSAAALARCLAISRNTDIEVRTGAGGQAFALTPRHSESRVWQSLPSGVHFVGIPARPVTFHSRGTAAPAGTFRISNGKATLRVVVAVSGRVRWSRE